MKEYYRVQGVPIVLFELRENYHSDAIVLREIWEENVYEVKDHHFTEGGTVIDIGANIGAFSIYAAWKGAKVYAIEPEPHNLEALKRNIDLSVMMHKITICPYAISDYKGIAKINDDGGGSTIVDNNVLGTDIEVMTLDNFFSLYHIDSVDVMKIDVEGAEYQIIMGASRESLQKCKYITMEFDIRTGKHMGDMVRKLSETHHVRTMGSWERGGMIWAWIY